MFVSDFMEMRIARGIILELRYKLRGFVVTLDAPSDVIGDNQGVVNNTSLPQYTLGKKQNSVNYHVICEATASGIIQVGWEDTETYFDDLLTKILGWQRLHNILPFVLFSG